MVQPPLQTLLMLDNDMYMYMYTQSNSYMCIYQGKAIMKFYQISPHPLPAPLDQDTAFMYSRSKKNFPFPFRSRSVLQWINGYMSTGMLYMYMSGRMRSKAGQIVLLLF